MIEIHEAMRLLVVVEADTGVLARIVERQAPLRELIGNGWVILAAKDPASAKIHRFVPEQGWVRWDSNGAAAATARDSLEWIARKDGPLPPALLGTSHLQQEQRS